jgi:hypothetical protein
LNVDLANYGLVDWQVLCKIKILRYFDISRPGSHQFHCIREGNRNSPTTTTQ